MFRVTVTTARADAFGPLPDGMHMLPQRFEHVPTYAEVRAIMVNERVKERIKSIDVRHIFMGRTVARFSPVDSEIVSV